MRKEYFTQGVVRLFIEVVGSPSMEAFKARLDGILGILIWWLATLPMAELELDDL